MKQTPHDTRNFPRPRKSPRCSILFILSILCGRTMRAQKVFHHLLGANHIEQSECPKMADQKTTTSKPVVLRADARVTGAPKYFTGVPCVHGHISERYTQSAICVACACERAVLRNEKEKAERPDARLKRKRAQNKRWRLRDPAKTKELERQQRLRQKQKRQAGVITVGKKRVSASVRDRYAFDLIIAQAGKCAHCATYLAGIFEVDHIMPIALGGPNVKKNLQLLCRPCNRNKSAAHPITFSQSQGRLV